MSLSTLPSNKSRTLFFVGLVACFVAALLTSAWYSYKINPEIRFYDEFLAEKLKYARKLDESYPSKVVIAGGSSTAFAIRPERLLSQHGIPAVNMGMQAGLGPDIIAALGVDALRSGDSFILSLEPELLGVDNQHVWGPQFCAATRRWYAVNRFREEPIDEWWLPAYLRPGGQHYVVFLAKLATKRPLFRYSLDDVHEGGWQTTTFSADLTHASVQHPCPEHLTERSRALLRRIRQYCEARKVQAFYSMPWRYVPPQAADEERARSAKFLADVGKYMSVLPDPTFGVSSEPGRFADVAYHTNAEGAAVRTDALAKSLRSEKSQQAGRLRDREAHGTALRSSADSKGSAQASAMLAVP